MVRQFQPIEGGDLFCSPYGETLVKAAEEGSKWIIYLQASNEQLDQESERILAKALKDVADYYVSHGVLSWDHKHKELNDPAFIIGEPLDVAFTPQNDTLIKGMLYKENKRAQAVFENIMSGAQHLGASVGGYILHKSADPSVPKASTIDRVFWDDTAVTHKPVNDTTYGHISQLPFKEFMKSLMAGGGVDAAQFTGGRALTPENLGENSDQYKVLFEGIWKAIAEGSVSNYDALIGYIVHCGYSADAAIQIASVLYDRLPNVVSRL